MIVVSANSKKIDHLRALDGANERLELFKADLLEEGSFDTAIEGCHGVFHTASPVLISASATDPQVCLFSSYEILYFVTTVLVNI